MIDSERFINNLPPVGHFLFEREFPSDIPPEQWCLHLRYDGPCNVVADMLLAECTEYAFKKHICKDGAMVWERIR